MYRNSQSRLQNKITSREKENPIKPEPEDKDPKSNRSRSIWTTFSLRLPKKCRDWYQLKERQKQNGTNLVTRRIRQH